MLVLSRKLGEKIFIGDNICITVVDIDRGKIRLGIEAPRDVPIYRQELLPLNQQRPRARPTCRPSPDESRTANAAGRGLPGRLRFRVVSVWHSRESRTDSEIDASQLFPI